MKRSAQFICLLLVAGMFLASGCKKAEKSEPSKKEAPSQTRPTEPAPVPEGTPKY
jgi:hypothetical protein